MNDSEKPGKFVINATHITNAQFGDHNTMINHDEARVHSETSKPLKFNASEDNGVFISYSRTDESPHVHRLLATLNHYQVPIWWDHSDIPYGSNWRDELNEGLEKSVCLILCASPEALRSEYVKMEYRYFLNQHKRIFVWMCQPVALPPDIMGIQYARYEQLDEMVQQVKSYCDQVAKP